MKLRIERMVNERKERLRLEELSKDVNDVEGNVSLPSEGAQSTGKRDPEIVDLT